MAINPKKVLLIRNTNAAVASLSATTSDWYAVARGLTEASDSDYFWMGFDLGNGSQKLATRLAADFNVFDTPGLHNPNADYVSGQMYSLGQSSASCKVLDSLTSPVVCDSHSAKITTSRVGQAIFDAIGSVINTYGIEAVFVLPGVPVNLLGPFYNQGVFTHPATDVGSYYGQHLEIALAHSHVWMGAAPYTRKVGTRSQVGSPGTLFTDGNSSGWNGVNRKLPGKPMSSPKNLASSGGPIAWGRVGSASNNSATWSTLATVQTMVNNAKAAEAVSNLDKLHVLGGTAYIEPGGVLDSLAVNKLGFDVGLTNFGYVQETFFYKSSTTNGNYDNFVADLGTDPNAYIGLGLTGGTVVSATQGYGYSEDEIWAIKPAWKGTPIARMYRRAEGYESLAAADSNVITTFGAASPRIGGDVVANKWAFAPGAWVYSWMSAADAPSYHCLLNGGSLGFTCAGEPYNVNISETASVLLLLFRGFTGAECTFRALSSVTYTGVAVRDRSTGSNFSSGGAYLSAHGDPLYAPYRFTAPKIMQVGN